MSRGDMFDSLQDHGHMTKKEAPGIFQQMVPTVQFCHPRGIIHRDLEPENMVLMLS